MPGVKEANIDFEKTATDLKNVLDLSCIVAVTDPQRRIISVNQKFCDISKYSRDELIGRDIGILDSGYHSESFFKDLWETLGSGRVWHGEIRNKAKDGTPFWVSAIITPLFNKRKAVYRHVAIFNDITRRKEDETRIRYLAAIVSDSNDAVTLLNLDGNIIAWNKGAERMYGYTKARALKMNISDMVPSWFKAQTLAMLKGIKSGMPGKSFETQRIAKDGRLLDVWLTVTRLTQNGEDAAIATTERDITEHKEHLASIKELTQRIILAQEDERNRIAEEVHDDFGQALIVLKMFIVTAMAGPAGRNPELKRVYKRLQNEISVIIDKARDLSHELAPPSLKYIGLVEAIKKMIGALKYDKGLKITLNHKNMSGVTFDSKDIIIYRIAQEALTNIVKHARAREVKVSMAYARGRFSLEIRDNGRGFNWEALMKRQGLGLDLMRERAELIKGTLDVVSRPRTGTTVKLTVPVEGSKKS